MLCAIVSQEAVLPCTEIGFIPMTIYLNFGKVPIQAFIAPFAVVHV